MIREFDTASLGLCHEMAQLNKSLWPKGLTVLSDVIGASLQHNLELSSADAHRYADLAVVTIAKHAGGQCLYLPTGSKLTSALRKARILKDSKHLTVRETAAKHDVTEVYVYQVLTEAGQGKRAKEPQSGQKTSDQTR